MRGAVITDERANKVYDILVEFAGASERGREDFVYHATQNGITEYRFCGSLGFGGKYWSDNRVSYYIEDETPERTAAALATNAALRDLKEFW